MKASLFGIVLSVALLGVVARADDVDPKLKDSARSDIGQLLSAMSALQFDCGSLPSDAQGLNALLADPGFKGWNGPYIKALPNDPWKTAYRYKLTKDFYEIRSAGPDAKFDTADDITPKKR